MKENSLFSPARFFLLIRNDMWRNWMGVVVLMGSILGVLVVTFSLILLLEDGVKEEGLHMSHVIFFPSILVFCLLMTGAAFKELHRTEDGHAWLALPGSHLEKYVNRLVLTSLGFYLLAIVFYTLFTAALEGLVWLFYGYTGIRFNLFDKIIIDYFGFYLVFHSLVLAGAIYFKRLGFIFTVMIVSQLITFAVVAATLEGITDSQAEIVKMINHTPIWVAIVLACWVLGYYLLKRTEV